MAEHAGALDVSEETVADADALMGTFDEPRNVGENELLAIDGGNAEIGVERGERIVRDLRPGSGHRRQEGRLAGVRQTDEAAIGDELQAQPDRLFLTFLSGIGMAGRLVGRGLEVGVAETAVTAGRQTIAIADIDEVADERLAILLEYLRTGRDLQRHAVATRAGAVAAHAVHAGLGLEVLLIAIVDQGVETFDGLDPDITAAAPVAAVGPAELDIFLAPERDGARAAIAGTNVDLGFVEKFHLV